MSVLSIRLKKLSDKAKIPTKAHDSDAGFDLFCAEEVEVKPGESVAVKTDIAVAIPDGCVGLIWDKSGNAIKRGLKVLGGVIDCGYTGEVKIGIINHGSESHTFEYGDKVAQLLVQNIVKAEFEEVAELDDTERGEGGFGSTGK